MAVLSLQEILTRLRRAALLPNDDVSDGQLLAQFIGERDEGAFETLVKRHGPMVLGVCLRLLGNTHDADDAFQATFLILVHKAASLKYCELVGNWLYGVAYKTALAARAKNSRRRSKEKQVIQMPEPAVTPPDDWSDLHPLLDQQLSRLSAVYREAVVLCDLEGMTRKEVARKLGIPEGTISSRLTTARRQLAKRLGRHGLTLLGGSVAIILSQSAVSAGVPTSLVASTVKAAAAVAAGSATAGAVSANVVALTEGVLKTMFLFKVKTVTAVVLAFLLATGVVLVGQALAAPQNGGNPLPVALAAALDLPKEGKDDKKKDDAKHTEKAELDKFQGTWDVTGYERNGEKFPVIAITFTGDKMMRYAAAGAPVPSRPEWTIKLDPSKKPKAVDATVLTGRLKGKTRLGIYQIEGDELKLCLARPDVKERPTEFKSTEGSELEVITLKRDNPYRTAKVGDFAVYKWTTKFGFGGKEKESTQKMTVTARDEKSVKLKMSSSTSAESERTIDLTKPYDILSPFKKEGKFEKTGEGTEKIKVAGKEYNANWISGKHCLTTPSGKEFNLEIKVWFSKDAPLDGLLRMKLDNNTNAELTESGSAK
jgi:RNA polymerase sigma factor (sigma-70 family)